MSDRRHRLLLAALGASILGFLVQDLSGWLEVSATTFFYVIVGAALALSQSGEPSPIESAWRSRIIPAAAVATTFCAVLTIEAAEVVRVDRLMRRSRLLAAQRQWDQMESTLASAVASRSRLPAEYFNLAGLRYADRYSAANAARWYEESAALFDEATARNPFAASPRVNRLLLDALAIQRQLPVEDVEPRIAALVAMDANNGAIHVALARVRLAQARYDDAMSALGAAEVLRPGDPRHDELRGDIEHARRNNGAALAAYREAVAGYEAEERALWIAASRKLILGMIEAGGAAEASAHADRVLASYPRESLIHALRGYAQIALGDPAAARRAFQTALVIDPANESARQGLASIQ